MNSKVSIPEKTLGQKVLLTTKYSVSIFVGLLPVAWLLLLVGSSYLHLKAEPGNAPVDTKSAILIIATTAITLFVTTIIFLKLVVHVKSKSFQNAALAFVYVFVLVVCTT